MVVGQRGICRTVPLVLVSAMFASALAGGPGLLTVRDLTRKADVVVLGTIAAVASHWNAARSQIFTRVELMPEELLKGTVLANSVYFVQPGGRVGDVGSVVAEAPSFTIGERVVVFLVARPDGDLGVIGLFQGKFTVERDDISGLALAVRRVPGSAQTTDRMTLDQLRAEVRTARGE